MHHARSDPSPFALTTPYPAGWLDRLGDLVDRLPGPNVLYCLGLALAELGYLAALLWLNGKLPVGSLDWRHVFTPSSPPTSSGSVSTWTASRARR